MAEWSSLPSDLVRRIADCLLSTNDLDCYIDFRAVCPSWRSATDDPANSSDPRFHPAQWIIIDEVFQSDARLLVNTVTGRVVRKDLPRLRRFYVVATTHGGFFVLADKEPPHAARILNPFTGHICYFVASVPCNIDISAASLGGVPFPNLSLQSDRDYARYTASADSEVFIEDSNKNAYLFMRLLASGGLGAGCVGATGVCAGCDCEEGKMVATLNGWNNKIFGLMKLFDIDPVIGLGDAAGQGLNVNSCFLVRSCRGLLVVVMLQHQLKVFNVTTCGDEPEPVKSIGGHAIFVGYRRCLCVSAEKFPSLDANCIYYVKYRNASIYKYDLEVEKEEMLSEAIVSLNPVTTSSFVNSPSSIVQLLSSYTINVRVSQLPMEQVQLPDFLFGNLDEISQLIDGMNFGELEEIPDN